MSGKPCGAVLGLALSLFVLVACGGSSDSPQQAVMRSTAKQLFESYKDKNAQQLCSIMDFPAGAPKLSPRQCAQRIRGFLAEAPKPSKAEYADVMEAVDEATITVRGRKGILAFKAGKRDDRYQIVFRQRGDAWKVDLVASGLANP